MRKRRVVLSKAELLNTSSGWCPGLGYSPEGTGRQRQRPCAVIVLLCGFGGHHIWVPPDVNGLERGSSAQSHLLAWRAHLLAGETLPSWLSICRALVSSCGAAVSGHVLPSPPLSPAKLLAAFLCILGLVGLRSGEPVGWDGNGGNFLPVLMSFWGMNLVRLFPSWRVP